MLAGRTGDPEFTGLTARVLRKVAASASRTAGGAHWDEITEILWGTAGTGCLLLTLGPRYVGPETVELAVSAGDWLITQAEAVPAGIRWSLGSRANATGRCNPDRRYPNFAHGAAGIAFFLARLAQETGERRFLDAALAGTGWVLSTARTGTAAATPGASAGRTPPPGTSRPSGSGAPGAAPGSAPPAPRC